MRFQTTTVHGAGRGRTLGFPTVNMVIPESFSLQFPQGVYAAHAVIDGKKYNGALYYGPAVVFGETASALEIYLLDTADIFVAEGGEVEIDTIKFIRPVMAFELPEQLIVQIEKDVQTIRTVLKR